MLRAVVMHDLMTRPWEERPTVTAHVTVVAPLDALEAAAAGASGTGRDPATVDGQPITGAQVRELLERLDGLCPGGLQAPTDGSLAIALTDAGGRLLATATRRKLERVARLGCPDHWDGDCACAVLGMPPPVNRYQHSPAQWRFLQVRDRTCRHPGCHNGAGWADLDHVIPHQHGGPTDCANLCCLCRRHHRLKTHAPGWRHVMTSDGILSVTTPSGMTRTSRPPGSRYTTRDLLRVPSGRRPAPDDADPPPWLSPPRAPGGCSPS